MVIVYSKNIEISLKEKDLFGWYEKNRELLPTEKFVLPLDGVKDFFHVPHPQILYSILDLDLRTDPSDSTPAGDDGIIRMARYRRRNGNTIEIISELRKFTEKRRDESPGKSDV